MAKLPTAQDLGPTPRAAPGRPVVSLAAGAQAIPEGIKQLGQGVAKLGEGVGEYALDENRWDYAKAHANDLSEAVELNGRYAEDRNYGPDEDGKSMPERYEKDRNEIRQRSAAMIRSGPMRERFMQETAPGVAHGVETIRKHAKNLENQTNVGYVHEMGDNLINKALDAKDDDTTRQLIDTHNQLVDGLVAKGAVTPDHAVSMKQQWAHQYATAEALRRAETDPEAVINELRARPGSNEAITNRILQIEGTGKNAKSSATGAGQFIDSTWLDVLKRNRPDLVQGKTDQELLALRGDKRLGREMTEAYRSENEAYLKKKGVDATPGAQHLAHFLGPTGAAAVLKGDPNKPVVDVLAATVGRKKAEEMVAANPTILQGQLAGSVKQWSDNKMGGQVPGGGSIYDQLRPDVREQLLAHARTQLQKQTVNDLSGFRQRYQDTVAEAYNNPEGPKQPMTMGDFVHSIGAEKAKVAYESYKGELDLASDMHKVESMTPAEMQDLYESYTPKAGTPGYADAAKRQDTIEKAISKVNEARKHPAELAANKLPASKEAWSNFMSASPEDRPAAARDYASKALLEQQRVDIPAEQRAILPKSYLDNIKKQFDTVADSDDPKARVNLIGRIETERDMWGEHWPAVMRQLAPTAQPIVRAISAGADPTAIARLLSLPKEEVKRPFTMLHAQNETRGRDITNGLDSAFKPLFDSMLPGQKSRDGEGYYNLAKELAATYVRDGESAKDAATKAFNALIGNRYDFKDTWRMPKSAGVSADDVQAGTLAARDAIGKGSLPFGHQGGMSPATDDMGLTDNSSDSFTKFARDGKFVTSYDNSGLHFMYRPRDSMDDKFVRKADGSPLLLTWPELAKMGKDAPKGFQMSWPRGQQLGEGGQPGRSGYPTDEDAYHYRAWDAFYGKDVESYANNKVARVLGEMQPGAKGADAKFSERSAAGSYLSDMMSSIMSDGKSKNIDLTKKENWPIADKLGNTYARAAISINRIPVAALGFDPSRVVMDTKIGNKVTIGGAYDPKEDSIYSNLAGEGTLVHESIHRGLEKLRDVPALKKAFKELPDEELVVRYLMATQAGDPEYGSGSVGDKQRSHALEAFKGPNSRRYQSALDEITTYAQQEIARKKPRGPR